MKISSLVERLAQYEPDGSPSITAYLNRPSTEASWTESNIWLKNEIQDASAQFEAESEEERRFNQTVESIQAFLDKEIDDDTQGVAVFASTAEGGFFETAQLDEPFPNNRFFTFERPHVYPLVRILEQNPKLVVMWADTNKADIYVFGGENHLDVETETKAKVEEIQNEKTRGTSIGGWSQARYQRHVTNFHLHHAKETVEEVEKLLRDSKIDHLILCGDETTVMPVLLPQLSKEAEEKLVAVINMSQYASENEIREATLDVLREKLAEKDVETVERPNTAAKSAAGLGTLGVENTLEALSNGQVEELVVSATFDNIRYNPKKLEKVLEAYAPGDDNSSSEIPEVAEKRQVGDELLIRAMNSAAKITFIEDPELMKDIGGVGSILRYSMNASAQG